MSTTSIAVSKTFKLTIKGHEIELTPEEAKELATALNAAVGINGDASDLTKILREVERANRKKDRGDFPPFTPWPRPYQPPHDDRPVPQWPHRPHPGEFYCSTSGDIRLALTQ